MSTETKEKGKHTPGPWRWLPDEGQFIVAANDYIVAEIPCQGSNPADGEFIVRAVNAHEVLVEACKAAEANLSPTYCSDHLVMKLLRAALVLAEGRE